MIDEEMYYTCSNALVATQYHPIPSGLLDRITERMDLARELSRYDSGAYAADCGLRARIQYEEMGSSFPELLALLQSRISQWNKAARGAGPGMASE